MHITAPMADFSFLMKTVTKSVSRLTTALAGSTRPERKMRYQRSDSCSDSVIKTRRFSGISFRGSNTSLSGSRSEDGYASLSDFRKSSFSKAHTDESGLGTWGKSVIDKLDKWLAEERMKSGASTPDAEKAARPSEEDIYTLPFLLYRKMPDNKRIKTNAVEDFQCDPPRIAANSADWARLLKPRVVGGTLKAYRGDVQVENRQTGATHLGDG